MGHGVCECGYTGWVRKFVLLCSTTHNRRQLKKDRKKNKSFTLFLQLYLLYRYFALEKHKKA
jgi:hypothetical protein